MGVEILTTEDFQRLKSEIIEEIKLVLNSKEYKQKKTWLKSKEVRVLLGISHGTLQNLRDRGILPFTKVGGIMYYSIEDVNAILEKNKNA